MLRGSFPTAPQLVSASPACLASSAKQSPPEPDGHSSHPLRPAQFFQAAFVDEFRSGAIELVIEPQRFL